MTTFTTWAIGIGAAVVLAFTLLFVWSNQNKKRLKRKHPISQIDQKKLEGRLLDFIKNESGDRREIIRLARFWKREAEPHSGDGETFGRRVPNVIREQTIRNLIAKKHIKLPEPPPRQVSSRNDQGAVEDIIQGVGETVSEMGKTAWEILKDGWALPATAVRLTDGTFDRMTRGDTGYTIIGGLVQHQHNDGTFFNSPPTQAGRDAEVSLARVRSEVKGNPFDPATLDHLVDIFRREADGAPEPFRSQLREVAAGVEKEAGQDAVDHDAVVSRMRRAKRIIASAGAVLAASSEAVKSWFELQQSV